MSAASSGYRPFMVADRPNHLRILEAAAERTQDFGVLSRAGVSSTVEELIVSIDVPVLVDSGAFADVETESDMLALFDAYDRMGADYGLLPDVIGDRKANNDLVAATSRLVERGHRRWDFQPVAVAQGRTPAEYAASFWDVYQMGADHIAIGGLLETQGYRSGGHATGRSSLLPTLGHIQQSHPEKWGRVWTFALGCDHPGRRPRFRDLGVNGADSKRWLFQYDHRAGREGQLADAVVTAAHDRSPSLVEAARRAATDGGLVLGEGGRSE